ncbi:hypothetical protein NQ317_019407 [Molorchus minor]|uniref:Major facilitator superfamily (MFS) profile domain-containing protein n=1 Tax=Molorchus minor TaxID=1323400 RepID=A0ABQ9JJ80_9CUCU|nr:hypothetical protein NQ317_019407 [Molorchus minor]
MVDKNLGSVYTIPTKIEESCGRQKEANFEEAILATEFGRFNILLLLSVIPACFSQVFETVSISYVLPVAQCDLNLTLEDKGMLNAITFAGMITSGFFWGYLCDSLGRKKIMIYGYLLNGCFVIVASVSPNITVLMISKFFGGFIINGPFAAATAYVTEFHSSRHRARAQMVAGTILSLGNIVLPLMAWGILPQELEFTVFDYFEFHSWNVYLLICSTAPILSGITFIFMPESPKFLMSAGRNGKALEVFRKIYSINTGKAPSTYPVSFVITYWDRIASDKNTFRLSIWYRKKIVTTKSTKQALEDGLRQLRPLFGPPNIRKLVLACFNTLVMMMGLNTMKLWLPQLFQTINDYQFSHGTSSSMCNMLEDLSPKNVSVVSCVVNLDNTSVYINSVVVGSSRIIAFGLAGSIVNLLGKKRILILMAIASGAVSTAIYFAQNSETVLVLSSMNIGFGSVCENVLIAITLELFPTRLRTVALSLHMAFGRVGTIIGNISFPYLLNSGCAPPLYSLACLPLYVEVYLSYIQIPRTRRYNKLSLLWALV